MPLKVSINLRSDFMDFITKAQLVAAAQTRRFPGGDDPFKIGCRILEEAGEVVWELNHYERHGISIEKGCATGKENLYKEAYQVLLALNQLMQYFGLDQQFKNRIDEVYREYVDNGCLSETGQILI